MRREKNLYRKIELHFGDALLKVVDTATINKTYASVRAQDSETASSLHKLHKTLKQVFKQAVNEQIIPRNPCDAVHLPTPKPVERKSFTLTDAIRLATILREQEPNGRTGAL